MLALDRNVMLGISGQLAGHGLVWAKQIASGSPIAQVLTPTTLFWAAFNLASETLTTTAVDLTGSSTAGVVAPAALQVAVLNMYEPGSKDVISRLSSGNISALADSPFLAGSLGAVIAKSYA